MMNCPNVLPGSECVDPECVYCKIAAAELPRGGAELKSTELKAIIDEMKNAERQR